MRPKDFEPDDVADAALQVFWQRGYAATSVQDLVEGTGLARSSLYNAFDSKHGLYQRALQRYQAFTAANVALLARPGPVKDRIRQLLARIVEDELGNPLRRGCMAVNAAVELAGHDEAVAELTGQNFLRLENALEAALREGQQSGEIAARQPPRALASFLLCTIQGLRVLGKGSARRHRRQRLHDIVEVAMSNL